MLKKHLDSLLTKIISTRLWITLIVFGTCYKALKVGLLLSTDFKYIAFSCLAIYGTVKGWDAWVGKCKNGEPK